jgi:ATP-dependent Lon protease
MMNDTVNAAEMDNSLDTLLNQRFAGKVVRKDLTKLIKEGANMPVYVLEYLLGMYCASDDEETIQAGLKNVKRILADNYVRPDEAEKVKSKIRESGSYKVIDKVTVKLNERRDVYEAILSNLGVKGVEISDRTVKDYEKLLAGVSGALLLYTIFLKRVRRDRHFKSPN